MPLNLPVAASKINPGGTTSAAYVRMSPAFGSENTVPASSVTGEPAFAIWFGVVVACVGAWLVASITSVCVTVPPWPSSAVTVTVYAPVIRPLTPVTDGAFLEAS